MPDRFPLRPLRTSGAGSPLEVRLPVPCARAARRVLTSSIARVIGPTPPGTGVIARARSAAASKSTSPTSPSSVRFVPTSITTAPSRTISPVTSRGEPTAAISTSASRQTAPRSRVREWQCVTVALAASSSCASGLPTRIERPITTARAPSSDAPASLSSSITPAGVQETIASARPCISSPAFTGVIPSTSLAGSISEMNSSWSRWSGQRELQQDPVDAVVGVEVAQQRPPALPARRQRPARGGRTRCRPPPSPRASCARTWPKRGRRRRARSPARA